MGTKLIEFKNKKGNILRGILLTQDKIQKKGIIFLHGFERVSTTENKFKRLADEFIKHNIASLRFDFTGCGLSDGDFKYTTIKSMKEDLESAISTFKEIENIKEFIVISHSLSVCVIPKIKTNFSKIVLIAPALNQKDLLRYWFVKNQNPNMKIDWYNYKQYLNEKEFEKYCKLKIRMTKSNYILNYYFLENKNKDYSELFEDIKNKVFHIHGDNDDKVPLENLKIKFPNLLIVKKGDHDLERPDMMKQWLKKCIRFIIEK